MTDETETSEEAEWTWREPVGAFIAVVAGLAALAGLGLIWGPLSDHILALAAVLFLGVPFFVLHRRGADFERFGIALRRIPLTHIGLGLAVTAAVFPLYAAGHHLWETAVENRQFQPAADNYRQWPVELDVPPIGDRHEESLQLRTVSNRLLLEWYHPDDPETRLTIRADRPFTFADATALFAGHMPADQAFDDRRTTEFAGVDDDPHADWYVAPTPQTTVGHLVWSAPADPTTKTPRRIKLEFHSSQTESPELFVGSRPHESDEPIEIERTHWWIVIWAMTHLILVALPEEYFYRGYLQTRLADLLGDDIEAADEMPSFFGFSRANWLTSGFFAIGHVLVPVGGVWSPARAAVFFPSLLFGWLRERSGSIIAPTVFHAGANMMVLLVAVHYF